MSATASRIQEEEIRGCPSVCCSRQVFLLSLAVSLLLPTGCFSPQYYEQSKNFLDQGRYRDALGAVDKALAEGPRSTALLMERAALYEKLERWNDALRDYDEVLQRDHRHRRAFIARGKLLERFKRYEEARFDFEKALALKKDDFDVALLHARVLNRLGKHEEAIEELTRILSVQTGNTEALFERGKAYFAQAKYAAARKDLALVLAERPGDVEVLRMQGIASVRLGEDQAGIRYLTTAVSARPDLPLAYLARGIAFQRTGENEAALKDLEEAERQGVVLGTKGMMARLLAAAGLDRREILYRTAEDLLSIDSTLVTVYRVRAESYEKQGRNTEAIADYERLSELEPRNPEWARRLALLWREEGDSERERKELDRYRRLGGGEESLLWRRWELVRSAGDEEEKLETASDLLERGIRVPEVAAARALLFAGRERWKEAAEDFDRAALPGEEEREVLRVRAMAYDRAGRYPEALREYERALRADVLSREEIHRYADLAEQQGDIDTVLRLITRLLSEASYQNALKLRQKRVELLTNLGREEEALAEIDWLLKNGVEKAQYYLRRGWKFSREGRYSAALKDFERAKAEDPRIPATDFPDWFR